eukprot:COSAG06_NODE_39539_length_411_cov_1.147436_1_plen_53_part_10
MNPLFVCPQTSVGDLFSGADASGNGVRFFNDGDAPRERVALGGRLVHCALASA